MPQSVRKEPTTRDLVGRPGACEPADIATCQPRHPLPIWKNPQERLLAWWIHRRATSPTLVVAHALVENQNSECITSAT
jgi:hypothetical protein